MKLPGFFKKGSRRSERNEEEPEYPGNAADEFPPHSDDVKEDMPERKEPPAQSEKNSKQAIPETPREKAPSAKTPARTETREKPKTSEQREPTNIETLWFSLVENPNNEKKLNQLIRYCMERKGPASVHAALTELSMEDKSFLPQLIMASRALERKERDEALKYYRELLSRRVPNDYTLLRITADLGRNRYPNELIDLALPYYIPEKHNEYIGLNLLQACVESGRISDGRTIWKRLNESKRPKIAKILDTFSVRFAPEKDHPSGDSSSDGPAVVMDAVASEESKPSAPERSGADRPVREDNPIGDISNNKEPSGIHAIADNPVEDSPVRVELPIWKFWIPEVPDILPDPDPSCHVGIYLFSDTSDPEQKTTESLSVASGLPLLIGERLLFSAPVCPVVLFPVSFSKGLHNQKEEPDADTLFALCAKESLRYLIAGTVTYNGDDRVVHTRILDRSNKQLKVLSADATSSNFGGAIARHISEIVAPFEDKNYAFETKRRGFTYSAPNDGMIVQHNAALMRLALRYLVDSGLCSSEVLCTQDEFLESLAQLCRAKPFSQNYLMMLLGGMISDRENGGETYIRFRDLLFDNAHKMQYTPCVTTARKSIDKVLFIERG